MTRALTRCSVDGCGRQHSAESLCAMHYQRARSGKPLTPAPLKARARKRCTVGGCDSFAYAAGLCLAHRQRKARTGDVQAHIPVRHLAPRGTGFVNDDGYRRIGGKSEHRMVMEQHLGRPLLPGENVHHKNGDRLDNRIENLELWVKKQPPGQRASDQLEHAREVIATYAGTIVDAGASQRMSANVLRDAMERIAARERQQRLRGVT